MKRTFLITAVIIMAAVFTTAIFVSCGDSIVPDLTQPEAQTAAGSITRTMAFTAVAAENGTVTLEYAPPASTSRSLSLPLARAATDFYEVIFVNDDTSKIWRRNFKEGEIVRMTIDAGTYNNTSDYHAYMFAGRQSTNTLLAVGKISLVEYKDATPDNTTTFAIDANTFRVTFELEALETNVRAHAQSSFKSWNVANTNPTHPAANEDYVDGESVVMASICNQSVPVFTIPKDIATEGTIEIKNSLASAIKAIFSADIFDSKGFFEEGLDATMADVAITVSAGSDYLSATPADVPDAFWVNDIEIGSVDNIVGLRIPITMTPQEREINSVMTYVDGLAVFTYSIPVYLFDNGTAENSVAATEWYLAGGLTNPLYDLGPEVDSQGGKIILGLGDLSGIKFIGDADDEEGFIVTPSGPTAP